jgi:hypothetical protein
VAQGPPPLLRAPVEPVSSSCAAPASQQALRGCAAADRGGRARGVQQQCTSAFDASGAERAAASHRPACTLPASPLPASPPCHLPPHAHLPPRRHHPPRPARAAAGT